MTAAAATARKPRYIRVRDGKGKQRLIRKYYRREFLEGFWHYQAGEHVTFLAPSQNGKTTFVFQLLMYTKLFYTIVFVMKPRDAVPAAWSKYLGFVEVGQWPPPKQWPWQDKIIHWTLWPPHTFKATIDNYNLAVQFRAALEFAYARGDCIVFADEVYGMTAELGLTPELLAIWTRGGGMGVGLWGATQRPQGTQGKGVPGHMYSNANHLFLSRDPDAASRKRYGEIGGVDPKLIESIILCLKPYEFLYIRKGHGSGGVKLAIIGAE